MAHAENHSGNLFFWIMAHWFISESRTGQSTMYILLIVQKFFGLLHWFSKLTNCL